MDSKIQEYLKTKMSEWKKSYTKDFDKKVEEGVKNKIDTLFTQTMGEVKETTPKPLSTDTGSTELTPEQMIDAIAMDIFGGLDEK